jgi:hypothetical protein
MRYETPFLLSVCKSTRLVAGSSTSGKDSATCRDSSLATTTAGAYEVDE